MLLMNSYPKMVLLFTLTAITLSHIIPKNLFSFLISNNIIHLLILLLPIHPHKIVLSPFPILSINTDSTYSKLRTSALNSNSPKQSSQSHSDLSTLPPHKHSIFLAAHDDSDDSNPDFENPLYIPTPLTKGPPIPLTKSRSTHFDYS